jgi:hypothetical protein
MIGEKQRKIRMVGGPFDGTEMLTHGPSLPREVKLAKIRGATIADMLRMDPFAIGAATSTGGTVIYVWDAGHVVVELACNG